MKRKLLISAFALFIGFSGPVFAGGLYTNTNQSATFARFMARGASIETDAVYYNPAGLAMLSEGWYFYFTNQSAFQTRTINNSLQTLNNHEYKGVANAPILPSFQIAWRTGDWALSAGFGVIGGGGKAEFDTGLPSFEAQLSALPLLLNSTMGTTKYDVDIYLNGTSLCYGGQLGATYKIDDRFAMFGGVRLVYASNGYDGYIKNFQLNFGGGNLTNAYDFLKSIGQDALANNVADKYVDVTQSGWGITPILGFNFNWENLNIGVKYEFNTNIDVTNKTKKDDVGMFPDGEKTHADIPSLLSVGASYRFFEKKLQVALGYHYYSDAQAKLSDDRQNFIDRGLNEYLWGIEWNAHKYFLLSMGGQFTHSGVLSDFQNDIHQSFSSYSLGFGGALKLNNDKIRINVGYFFTDYQQAAKQTNYLVNIGIPAQTETYNRTNNVFAIGVDFRL